jgi:hypothetical protein
MIFRAGGNGWYPGATPPTEWSEGTPVQIDMKGIYGSERKESVRKVWDFADTKSKNILWKVHRGRSDNKAMARFVIVDVKDPANPKMVSDKNWLGFAEPPSDIFIEQYYKDIDPFQFVGCYAGAVSQFLRMGGMVPVGNRLLIQTSAFLYCIGVK